MLAVLAAPCSQELGTAGVALGILTDSAAPGLKNSARLAACTSVWDGTTRRRPGVGWATTRKRSQKTPGACIVIRYPRSDSMRPGSATAFRSTRGILKCERSSASVRAARTASRVLRAARRFNSRASRKISFAKNAGHAASVECVFFRDLGAPGTPLMRSENASEAPRTARPIWAVCLLRGVCEMFFNRLRFVNTGPTGAL